MSQNEYGNIYNDPIDGDLDFLNNIFPSKDSYLYNLHRLQYLIAKVLLGTSRYYNDNINIYRNIPQHPNPGQLSQRVQNTTDYTTSTGDLENAQCNDSNKDYLLLVFKNYGNSVDNLNVERISDCTSDAVSLNDQYNTGILSDGNICKN